MLGPGAVVGAGVRLEDVTVGDGARVEAGATVAPGTRVDCGDGRRPRAPGLAEQLAEPARAAEDGREPQPVGPTVPSTKNSARFIRSWPASTATIANGGKPLAADKNSRPPATTGRSWVRLRHTCSRASALGVSTLRRTQPQFSAFAPR